MTDLSITTDRSDPGLQKIRPDGQQESYLALSEEERAKGYVLPVRREYRHALCGGKTTMPVACAETYARDPKFYGGTFCCACGKHFPLIERSEPQFHWWPDGDPVGATAEESQVFLAAKKQQDIAARIRHLEVTRESLLCQAECMKQDIIKLKDALR
jgi:hypothetical protein